MYLACIDHGSSLPEFKFGNVRCGAGSSSADCEKDGGGGFVTGREAFALPLINPVPLSRLQTPVANDDILKGSITTSSWIVDFV